MRPQPVQPVHGFSRSACKDKISLFCPVPEYFLSDTSQNFNPTCGDALEFNYSGLNLKQPIFFIGGLAQMGGDVLATGVIDKINSISNLKNNTGMVFTGTHTKRQLSGNLENGGWSSLIEKHGLNVIDTVSLPTVWTFDQTTETPYIYTEFK